MRRSVLFWSAVILAAAIVCGGAAAVLAQQGRPLPDPAYWPAAEANQTGPAGQLVPAADDLAARVAELEAALKKIEDKAQDEKKGAGQQGYVVGSDLKMNAGWNNGVVIESAHKDFRIQIGARFQNDWVFFNEPASLKAAPPVGVGTLQDGTFFRRLRLQAKGQAWERTEFNLEFDFENINTITMDHMWWGVKELPVLGTVRVGQHKVPQSMESYQDSKWLTFLCRSASFDAYMLEFSPGIFASNNYLDQHLTWEAMFHRGPGLSPRFQDANTGADFGAGEYAATGRVTLLPIYECDGRYLLHLGTSYQFRRAKFDSTSQTDVVQFRTRSEIRDSNGFALNSNNNRFLDTGLIQADDTQLLGAEVMGNLGSLNVRSEYFLVVLDGASVRQGSSSVPLGFPSFYGFYVQASYFLTGEHQPYDRRFGLPDRPKPFTNFFWVKTEDGCCRGLGLWELAARYSIVDFSNTPVVVGTGGVLPEFSVGLNWWLNTSMKVQWNYVHAKRDVPAPNNSGGVDEFAMRFHIDF